MARKMQKLKPDTVLRNYWRNNERFADFFNAVLFDGKQLIKPEELEDRDTEESSILEHRKYAETIQSSRDNIKIRKRSTVYGVEFVMLGIEHQDHIHYAMPMRIMGYDYGVYKKQYDDNSSKYKTAEGMEADEYLSHMKKTDKFAPLITVVVYYGEKKWDGAVSLHGMLDIPEEMKGYVNDYKMLLIEAAKSDLSLKNADNVDLFNLLQIILDREITRDEAREKAIQYSEERKTDREVVMTVAGATNSKIDYNAFGKGDGSMCTLFEQIARENETKGIEKGIEKGIKGMVSALKELNIPDATIMQKIREKFELSWEEAERYITRM